MGCLKVILITFFCLTLVSCVPGPSTTANKTALADSANPSVTSVTSSNGSLTYKIGDVIYISVYFSGPVTVENFPNLALNSGGYATYSSGSKTNQLIFKYTVAAGEASSGLDYSSTTSLSLNGGKIKGSSGGNAKLSLPSPGATNSLRVNKYIVVDGVAPKVTSVTASTANGNYTLADTILIEMNFDSAVTVSGTPELSLDSGGTAKYKSGSTSSKLVFSYVVKANEKSKDLNYTSINSLTVGQGSIKDSSGNDGSLLLPETTGTDSLATNKNIIVNSNRVSVVSVTTLKESGTYGKNVIFDIIVKFSNLVSISGSTVPRLQLNVNQLATYISGSGKNELKFRYTSASGDYSEKLDYSGIDSLLLNGSSILDTSGYEVKTTLPVVGQSGSLSYSKSIIVDAVLPKVVSVAPEGSTKTFLIGSTLNILVTFDKAVYVLGTPTLKLSNTGVATYLSGSGSTVLKFQYKVMQGSQYNITGLNHYSTSALELNGGTITDIVSNAADLTLPVLTSNKALGYGGTLIIDTIPAYVTSFTSTSDEEEIYKEDDKIAIKVVFSKKVTVTGKPSIKMNTTNNGYAKYVSGSGTTDLIFSYKVESEQKTPTSSFLNFDSSSAFNLNGATIVDSTGYSANLILDSALTMVGQEIEVNSVRPMVESISVSPLASSTTDANTLHNTYYTEGSIFYILVTLNSDVIVSNDFAAKITLNSGGVANYDSQPSDNILKFKYIVEAGENSAKLDKNKFYAFAVQTGSVTNGAGTIVNPFYDKSITDDTYKVKSDYPAVTAVSINAATGMGYGATENLDISVTYSSVVMVTPAPRIQLNLGSATFADYISGSGSTTLVFRHTVTSPDVAEILEYTSPIDLNGGTMKDVANNDAVLTVSLPTPLRFGKLIEIASEQVNVVSVHATPASGVFFPGDDAITIDVKFDRKVYITTGSSLQLKLNSGANASYSAISSDSKTVTFVYSIGTGDSTADLDVDTGTPLLFSGSAFKDLAGNIGADFLSPTAGSLADNSSIIINGSGLTNRRVITGGVTGESNGSAKYQEIDSIAISPSGRYVYANGSNGKITLLSRAVGSPLATIPNNTSATDLLDSTDSPILNSTRLININNNCLISYDGSNIYTHSTLGVTPDIANLPYVSETPVANLQDMIPSTNGNLLLVESATKSIRAMNISRDCAIDEIADKALVFDVGTMSASLDGRFAYILDTSDTTKINVVKFNEDNATFTGPTPLPTAFNGYPITKADISPDGYNLYLISGDDNAITKYDRTPDTGLVGNPVVVVTPDAVNLPDANLMKIGRSGQYLYVANSGSIITYERDLNPTPSSFGNLKAVDVNSQISNISTDDNMLVTNDGRNIYTSEKANDKLWTVQMKPETAGNLAKVGPYFTLSGYVAAMIPPDGRHLYFLSATGLAGYDRNQVDGTLGNFSSIGIGLTNATNATFSHDGNTLLLTDVVGTPFIKSFTRNLSTGELTFKNALPMNTNDGATRFSIKTSLDDKAVYVSPIYDGTATAVHAFKLAKDGTLAIGSSVGLARINSMELSVDDKRLYISYLPTPLVLNNKIANISIGLDGTNYPVAFTPSNTPTNFTNYSNEPLVDPGAIAIHPQGKYIYMARKLYTTVTNEHVIYKGTRSDTTGLISSWDTYSLNSTDLKRVYTMTVSPDGRSLYAIIEEEAPVVAVNSSEPSSCDSSWIGGPFCPDSQIICWSSSYYSRRIDRITSSLVKTYRLVHFSVNQTTGALTLKSLPIGHDFIYSYTSVTTSTSKKYFNDWWWGCQNNYIAYTDPTTTAYTYSSENSLRASASHGAITPVFSLVPSQDNRSIYITTNKELLIFQVQ